MAKDVSLHQRLGVTFGKGERVTGIDFGNHELQPGSISGTKWNDVDGDGNRDAGESPVAGVTIYLDINGNGKLDDEELTDVTDADGAYEFTGLSPDVYMIRENVPSGFEQTFPPPSAPLSQVLADLDANYQAINSLIPSRFNFSGGARVPRVSRMAAATCSILEIF